MARSTYDDFLIKEKIGSGSYGVVFKVIRKVDRQTYAMKEIDLQGMSRKEQEECIRETRVLSSLDSDYIIKYYDSFLERGKLYIITEHAANGNLHDYIKRQKQRLPEELIWKLYVQILMGLNHMHARKILHRDIKTLNVFLDEKMNVKLGDMGVAKILSTQTNFAKTIVGTPYYLSPELCEDKPYNEKSDVWALGVVLYECCTQRHPFDADNQGALILKILRGKYPAVSGYSPDIADLIKRCLTQNANRRPNTYKLLLLTSIRQKAEELGVPMPDQQTLIAMAEKAGVKIKNKAALEQPVAPPAGHASPAPHAKLDRPPSARHGLAAANAQAAAEVRALPAMGPVHNHGVIRVVGDMDNPPVPMPVEPSMVPTQAHASNDDKAFVFGATMPRTSHVDVSVSGVEATAGAVEGMVPGMGQPLEAAWQVKDVVDAPPEPPGMPRNAVQAWGQAAAAAAADLSALALEDEEEGPDDEDEANNPYHNIYREPEEDAEGDDDEEDDDVEEEDGEDYEEDYDDYEEGDEAEGGAAWQPDPARVQHMRSAMMLQRAACLDLIGEKAFNELYALLKSNQVDEASMTDLSRLVFKIIPYDKSEVIQMMYKLLYLESQLEGTGAQ